MLSAAASSPTGAASAVSAAATWTADGRAAGSLAVIAASRPGQGAGSWSGIGGGPSNLAITEAIGGPGKVRSPVSASNSTRPSA